MITPEFGMARTEGGKRELARVELVAPAFLTPVYNNFMAVFIVVAGPVRSTAHAGGKKTLATDR